MEENKRQLLEKLREGRTAVLEKEEPSLTDPEKDLFEKLTRRIDKPISLQDATPTRQPLTQTKELEIIEPEENEQQENVTQGQEHTNFEDNTDGNEDITPKPKPKSLRFRRRLVVVVMICIIGISALFGVHNAVKLARLNTQVATQQAQYEINLTKYLKNIDKLDKLKDADNIEGTTEVVAPIPEIRKIQSTPLPLAEPAENTKQSNWFDYIVNKISKLFGR